MGLKAKIEAVIYAAEEPVTLEQISLLVKDIVLAEEAAAKIAADAIAEPEALDGAAVPKAEDTPAADADGPTEPVPVGDASTEFSVPEPDGVTDVTDDAPAEIEGDSETAGASDTEAAPTEDLGQTEADAITEAPAEVVELAESEAAPIGETTPTEPESQASVAAPGQSAAKRRQSPNPEDVRVRLRVRSVIEELIVDYSSEDRGMEIRQVAGGFRMATKPQHHDVVRAFARSLKPPVRLSLAALETLAVIAYKQPVTAPEITEIRGVESGGVLGTLLDRKLITTAGRKQVIGRPILYKTSKQFLMRFGLNHLNELPSMEEFEKLAIDGQVELFTASPETPAQEEPETANSEDTPSPIETASAPELSSEEDSPAPPSAEPSAAPDPEAIEQAEKDDTAPADIPRNGP
jgi:segregation and condensation protein B